MLDQRWMKIDCMKKQNKVRAFPTPPSFSTEAKRILSLGSMNLKSGILLIDSAMELQILS